MSCHAGAVVFDAAAGAAGAVVFDAGAIFLVEVSGISTPKGSYVTAGFPCRANLLSEPSTFCFCFSAATRPFIYCSWSSAAISPFAFRRLFPSGSLLAAPSPACLVYSLLVMPAGHALDGPDAANGSDPNSRVQSSRDRSLSAILAVDWTGATMSTAVALEPGAASPEPPAENSEPSAFL